MPSTPARWIFAILAAALLPLTGLTPAQAGGSDPGYTLTDTSGTPLAGTTVGSPVTIRLDIPAGVTPSKVKFLADNTYLGEVTAAPWEWTTYLTPGARQIKARATTPSGDKQAIATITATLTALPAEPEPLPEPSDVVNHIAVSTSAELEDAVLAAQPGDAIDLADGTYETNGLTATADGTAEHPITIIGSRNAIITSDDGFTGGSYGLHLSGADWWRLQGFTISDAKKGLVLDDSDHALIDDLRVTQIGHEGIHLRQGSSDCWVTNNEIDHTGLDNDGYGEGLYVGSASSNWHLYGEGGVGPDRSDRNTLVGNTIHDVTAEAVDIKEGTTGGVLAGNSLDGSAISGGNSADSWVDIKGSGWTIRDNTGTTSPGSGIDIHVAVNGWGSGNWLTGNTLLVNGPGAGVQLVPAAVPLGNIIGCSNLVTGAASGDYRTTAGATVLCTIGQ